ncbi:hypothetical protein KIM372_04570 [Bombiscardovia nodaiensis]|uniref:GP-PDE domain-containing protein n=1 Tax=Bombiscardovia nodaiensis TaxID=2932181 RepID=A0ABM8B734_9BIFI|nr:hypothetical protein KIM372_04570 [Bombiscardovia nodaiensis]
MAEQTTTRGQIRGHCGQKQYEKINKLINEALDRQEFLITSHRSTPRGSILENTLNGIIATERVGADIAEIDIVRSVDGEYFAFHDEYELSRLSTPHSLSTLTAQQIQALNYTDRPGMTLGKVEKAGYILSRLAEAAPHTLLNIDRSWRYWGSGFLDWLDQFGIAERLIIKSPANDDYLRSLAQHQAKYPFMVKIQTTDAIDARLTNEAINCVGVELSTPGDSATASDEAIFRAAHSRGLYTFVNALDHGYQGFGGIDDAKSVLDGPESGWGLLLDEFGADIIQTDWPEMLVNYREQRAWASAGKEPQNRVSTDRAYAARISR